MVEIMFPEIRPSSILFEKMLSIRVLECVVTRDGNEMVEESLYIMNQEMKHRCIMIIFQ